MKTALVCVCVCVCVCLRTPVCSSAKKKLSRYWRKFCECWKIRKKLFFYFCQTCTHVQEQSFPMLQWIAKIKNPPQCKYNCPSLLSTIVLSISSYTKKKSQPKSMKQVFLSFQTKVGNRSIYDNKVSCFISSFNCFCCVPILYWKSWSFLLVVEHQ